MNQGQPVETLVADILRSRELKHDYVAPSTMIAMNDGKIILGNMIDEYTPNNLFHEQAATYMGVPKKFYDRIRTEHPDLHENTFNTLMKDRNEPRLVRTMGDTARSLLSDRYRRLDNDDIASFILPIVQDNKLGLTVKSAYVNDRKLFFQVVSEKVQGEIRVGDAVRAGFIISNSEVGLGALSARMVMEVLRCTNGMIVPQESKRHTHLGSGLTFDSDLEIMSTETIEASNKALMLQLRDYLSYIVSEEGFHKALDQMKEVADDQIKTDPFLVVETLGKSNLFSEDETKNVLANFLSGNDMTRWGLSNAITAAANEHPDYERAIALEELGGKIMFMPKREFIHVAAGV